MRTRSKYFRVSWVRLIISSLSICSKSNSFMMTLSNGNIFRVTHYGDVIMDAIASQITSLTIVYSIVYSDADQRKRQSSASLAFVRGIHRGPVNSPHKWPVTRKMFPFYDVIMLTLCEGNPPLTKTRDEEFWCSLWFAPKQKAEQTLETLVFGETPSRSLWRHCNVSSGMFFFGHGWMYSLDDKSRFRYTSIILTR